jgi:hypothetical protein
MWVTQRPKACGQSRASQSNLVPALIIVQRCMAFVYCCA